MFGVEREFGHSLPSAGVRVVVVAPPNQLTATHQGARRSRRCPRSFRCRSVCISRCKARRAMSAGDRSLVFLSESVPADEAAAWYVVGVLDEVVVGEVGVQFESPVEEAHAVASYPVGASTNTAKLMRQSCHSH